MAIPLSYNLRNLWVRKTTTLMTALGIGLTVAVLLSVMALVAGLQTAFQATGNPLNVLIMRQGSTSELTSNFTRTQYQDLKFKPGVAVDSAGQPMVSLEVVTIVNLESLENPDGINITLRGLPPVGLQLRDGVKIAQGRWFQPGQHEVVVGRSVAKRNPPAALGKKIHFGRSDWTVVGVFDGGDSAVNSEIWADLNMASSDLNRPEVLSSALVRVKDEATVEPFINNLKSDQRLAVDAVTEKSYYESQTSSANVLLYLGIFVSIIMAVGSSFAAMNTMYAAVARRAREIGTLRVLGFSKGSILLSFFFESLLIAVVGGLVGCILVLPLNGLTTGVGSMKTFSDTAFNFRVTPLIMVVGIVFASFVGACGGLFPAGAAARKEILVALREI